MDQTKILVYAGWENDIKIGTIFSDIPSYIQLYVVDMRYRLPYYAQIPLINRLNNQTIPL